jgi:hypothetical protein
MAIRGPRAKAPSRERERRERERPTERDSLQPFTPLFIVLFCIAIFLRRRSMVFSMVREEDE